MTVRDDLATLRELVKWENRDPYTSALVRVEAEIARLEAEAKHGERAWEQMRGRAEKAEAEVVRLTRNLDLTEVLVAAMQRRAEAAEAEAARLRDGLRFYANEDDYLWYGDERGTIQKNDRGAHARTLLADQDGAAKDAAPGVAATPTQRGATPEGNDGEPGDAQIGGAA